MKKLVFAPALCLPPVAAALAQEPQREQPVTQNESAKPTPTPQPTKPKPLVAIPEEALTPPAAGPRP